VEDTSMKVHLPLKKLAILLTIVHIKGEKVIKIALQHNIKIWYQLT